jgi:hypothetical protein
LNYLKTIKCYDWNSILTHLKEVTGKDYNVGYLRKIIKNREKNLTLKPILEEMGLMEERK